MPNSIEGLSSTTGAPPSSAAATGSRALGKNEFLKLLTTQLANQDPLAPTDNQAFIAQLAQFASVEQAEAANSRLDALIIAQAANNQTSVANLVGKDIIYRTDSIAATAANPTPQIQGELAESATQVNAIITDENGKEVAKLVMHDQQAGTVSFDWGTTSLPPGKYKVTLTAKDEKGESIAIAPRNRARATGVTFEAGYPELILNGVRVKMSDIIQIAEAATTNAPPPGA
ncbi:MAG: flagellar hook capping FlgD N-terminal domain-containing protein [Archangium sp.]|nr:flagellar hook capping FlgD N-terminal domain-containing protein [Archangium sp.]